MPENKLMNMSIFGQMLSDERKLSDMIFHCHLLIGNKRKIMNSTFWTEISNFEIKNEDYYPKNIQLKVGYDKNKIYFYYEKGPIKWDKEMSVWAGYLAICFEDKVLTVIDFGHDMQTINGHFIINFPKEGIVKINKGD